MESPAAFPPHARGWTPATACNTVMSIVSPARAGMDPRRSSLPALRESFPRTRGDGPVDITVPGGAGAFPPHARGWTLHTEARQLVRTVSPARAGMDRKHGHSPSPTRRFPRTRGDGPETRALAESYAAFPPHARGWTDEGPQNNVRAAVSPARAGMDPCRLLYFSLIRRFPRTRGDGPLC